MDVAGLSRIARTNGEFAYPMRNTVILEKTASLPRNRLSCETQGA